MLLPTCPGWPYLQGRGTTRDLTPLLKSFKSPWVKIKECCQTNLSKRLSLYSCHAPSNYKCRNIDSLPVTDIMSSNPARGLLLKSQKVWNSRHTKSSILVAYSDAPLMDFFAFMWKWGLLTGYNFLTTFLIAFSHWIVGSARVKKSKNFTQWCSNLVSKYACLLTQV